MKDLTFPPTKFDGLFEDPRTAEPILLIFRIPDVVLCKLHEKYIKTLNISLFRTSREDLHFLRKTFEAGGRC